MTETTIPQEELQQDNPSPVLPGTLLKEGRERKNMTQEAVANQLNLKHAFVSQIEENDFDQLPGAAFIRGYLRAYSKLVELDSDTVIDAYNNINHEEKKPENRYKPVDAIKPQRNFSDPLIKYTSLIVLAAIVALSIMWWQSRNGFDPINLSQTDTVTVETSDGETVVAQMDLASSDEPAADNAEAVAEGEQASAESAEQMSSEGSDLSEEGSEQAASDDTLPEPQAAVDDDTLAVDSASRAVESDEVASVDVATADTGAASATDSQGEERSEETAPPAVAVSVSSQSIPDDLGPTPDGLVRFVVNYEQECWVEISDARGIRVVNNLKKPGEQSIVTGLPPFKLMIGNAGGAEVIYMGEVVDLTPHTNRNSIARMSLGSAEDVN